MDKDCNLPADDVDTKEFSLEERDLIVGNVYRKCAATPWSSYFQCPILIRSLCMHAAALTTAVQCQSIVLSP